MCKCNMLIARKSTNLVGLTKTVRRLGLVSRDVTRIHELLPQFRIVSMYFFEKMLHME